MTAVCPRCGFNLERDTLIERDGFVLDPRGMIAFHGRPVKMRASGARLLHLLAKSAGRVLSRDVIYERLFGGDAADTANFIAAIASQARAELRREGIPDPICNQPREGLFWRCPAALESAA